MSARGDQGDPRGPRLVLAPASERGWFGGAGLIASDAADARTGVSVADAAAELQAAFDGEHDGLVAALARYDGECTVVRFGSVRPVIGEAVPAAETDSLPLLRDPAWDMSGREFRAAVRRTRERIAAGDVYVVNITARLSGRLSPAFASHAEDVPAAVFSALQSRAAADMSALFDGLPGTTPWLASVSPERFLRVTRDRFGTRRAEIHPIKGTAPRGVDAQQDARLAERLRHDPKELAEHVMVVDLERNDLGTCCIPGTVKVDPLFEVVQTPYCHQLVSRVVGVLRADATFAQLLAGTFPCGSVTGAPKRAAMRLIDELESSARGAYCGALLVAQDGSLDSSVLIRTLEADAAGGARWGAGCGITFESDPSYEYLELLLKTSPVSGDAPPPVALRETMRVASGRVPLLDRHLARLAAGGVGPRALARVRAEVDRVLGEPSANQAYARLGITVAGDGAVQAELDDRESTLSVTGGPIVVPVEVGRAPELPPASAKPADRGPWDHAHLEAVAAGGHQAVLVAGDGALIDGSTATVWLRFGDTLLTPPSPPAVAGVARELVFDLAGKHGLAAAERALTIADLCAADDVWLSNALGGFVQARRLDEA